MPARYAGFLEVARETLRTERYAYRTDQTYMDWARRFLIFASPKSRREIEAAHAREYLEYLTLVRRVSASTQNQALNALQFLFTKVLKRKMGMLDELASEDHKVGYAAHAEAFVCYAFARSGRGHTNRAGAAWAFGCKHDSNY